MLKIKCDNNVNQEDSICNMYFYKYFYWTLILNFQASKACDAFPCNVSPRRDVEVMHLIQSITNFI